MSKETTSLKYYQSFKSVWKQQRPYLIPIFIMFVLTLLYASGLQNDTVQKIMYCMSLVYPVVISITLLGAISSLNYIQLDAKGINSTTLGVIHKRIKWSDVEAVGTAAVGTSEVLGIKYKTSVTRFIFGRKSRQKMFGWDELLPNIRRSTGTALIEDAVESFKKYSA